MAEADICEHPRTPNSQRKRGLGAALLVSSVLVLAAVSNANAALPAVTVEPATEITQSEATLHATVNPEGKETRYEFSVSGTNIGDPHLCENGVSLGPEAVLAAGTQPIKVSMRIKELAPGTQYCFAIQAFRAEPPESGQEVSPEEMEELVESRELTFVTPGTASEPPDAVTEAATNVNANEATLNASVNPDWRRTEYYFQYGTEAGHYSASTPHGVLEGLGETGGVTERVSYRVKGLKSGSAYHYRIVATNVGGERVGEDQTFYTTPEWPHVFFSDASAGNTLSDWTYNPSRGWHIIHFGHDYVAPKSSPSATLWNGLPNVFFSDGNDKSKEDSKGEVSDWNWSAPGWNLTPFYQDEVAANTSPSAMVANGAPDVFFADGPSSPTLSNWTWNNEKGWHIERLGKDYVSAGSSPAAILWKNETPQVFFPDGNDNSEMSLWQWNGGAGWQLSNFFQDYVLPGTSASPLIWGATPNVFFVDGLQSDTLADWVWSTTGWHLERFYQDSVAAGTSPSAIMINGLPHVFFVDASTEDRLADWTWNSERGWHIVHLEQAGKKDYAAAGTSPSPVMWGTTVNVFFVDGLDNNEMSDWVGTGEPSQWHVENFFQDAVAAGTNPSALMWGTLLPEAPVGKTSPEVLGSSVEFHTLSTSDGTWTGAPTSYSFQWQRCASGTGKCSNIEGATSKSYQTTAVDIGYTVQAVVTASGPGGFGSATSVGTYIDSGTKDALATGFGTVTNGLAGPFSGAVAAGFSGSGSGASSVPSSIRTTSTPITSTANWSLEAWINPSTLNQNGMAIFDGDQGGGGGGDDGFGFAVAGAQGGEYWGGCLTGLYEGVAWIDTGYCFPSANKWYYVVETNNGGAVTFYVNSVKVYSGTPGTPGTPSGMMIGGYDGVPYGGFGGRWFQGDISNAAFYSASLTARQISAHYEARTSESAYSSAVLASSPSVYYKLNDGLIMVAPPTASTPLPAISGTVKNKATLSTNAGTFGGGAIESYAYQWKDCNIAGEGCSNISGATAAQYTLTANDVGHTVRVAVTATNSAGSATDTSNATVEVSG